MYFVQLASEKSTDLDLSRLFSKEDMYWFGMLG